MKLGSETGSLINHLYSGYSSEEPKVGMGVTILHWSDRTAGTIFRVFKVGKSTCIEVREDECIRTDSNGMSEDQEYEYRTCVNGTRRYFRLEDNGWVQISLNKDTGRWKKTGSGGILVGQRRAYYDFTF